MSEHAATGVRVPVGPAHEPIRLVGSGPLLGAARRAVHQRLTLGVSATLVALGSALLGAALAASDGDPLSDGRWPALAVFTLGCLISVSRLGEVSAITRFTGLPGRLLLLWAGSGLSAWAALIANRIAGGGTAVDGLMAASAIFPLAWVVARPAADRPFSRRRRPAVIVGSGEAAVRLRRSIERAGGPWDIQGWVDELGAPVSDWDLEHLGALDDLPRLVTRREIETVIVAFSPRRDEELAEVIRRCDGLGAEILMLPRLFELVDAAHGMARVGAFGLVRIAPTAPRRPQLAVKRVLDVVGAGLGLVLLSPAFLVISLAVMIDDGRPVFFRQRRVGRHGEEFRMVKFRTMRRDAEAQERAYLQELSEAGVSRAESVDLLKLAGAARITRMGRFLRATSLDELPQLWNVVRGDMSLVGPRPLPLSEAPAVEGWQHHRHDLRPGITGLWQVLGRSDTPWPERMRLDYLYVRNWSLLEDLRILVRTIGTVAARDGAR